MVQRICLSLSLSFLLGASLDATQEELPAGWKSIASRQGGFRVAMPAAPTESKKVVKTATGQLNVLMLVAEGRQEALFVVSYSDYPEAESMKETVARRLDYARDGAVSSARGKLRSEKLLELEGHPGREIVIENMGNVVARMRIYLVERRLYQVMVLGSAAVFSPREKDVGFFLDSFRLYQ